MNNNLINFLFDPEDVEIYEYLHVQHRRPYTVRVRYDYMTTLDDHDFKVRFRLSKRSVHYVLQMIGNKIESRVDR